MRGSRRNLGKRGNIENRGTKEVEERDEIEKRESKENARLPSALAAASPVLLALTAHWALGRPDEIKKSARKFGGRRRCDARLPSALAAASPLILALNVPWVGFRIKMAQI